MRGAMTRESDDLRPGMSGETGQDVGAYFIHSLRRIRTVGVDDFIFSPEQKIYIVEHGGVGLVRIAVDDKAFTMSDIANTLVVWVDKLPLRKCDSRARSQCVRFVDL